MGRPKGSGRTPICGHPERQHHGLGLCWPCYYQANNEKAKIRARKHYEAHRTPRKDAIWARHIERFYGVTVAQYNKMFSEQDGVCVLCKKPPCDGKFKRLHIDHCHKTGRIRGLLCRGCNGLVGWFEKWKEPVEEYLNG